MANDSSPVQNRRRYFRVKYPDLCRPIIHLGALAGAVVDVSEVGLRVILGRKPTPEELAPGSTLSGTVVLHDQRGHLVSGRIVRVEGSIVALELTEMGLAFPVLVSEQRWLRRWYTQRRGR